MLGLAAQAIEGIKDGGPPPSPAPGVRRWRLVDRLGEQVIRQLLEDRRGGMTKQQLVERYNISLSSVKRIIGGKNGL
jgi:DNA invertase Pin-like site-specific DNA recombinase